MEFFRPAIDVLNRDNVGLVLLLRPLLSEGGDELSPSHLCVANTHLLYNPRRGDIKLAQLALLLAEVDKVSGPPGGRRSPIILCGDLNTTPHSPLYQLLHNGVLNCYGLPAWKVGAGHSGRGVACVFIPCDLSVFFPRCRVRSSSAARLTPGCCPSPSGRTFWGSMITVSTPRPDHQRSKVRSLVCTPPLRSHWPGQICDVVVPIDRRMYSRQRLLELRFCGSALQRPPNLPVIKGVTDNTPGG